MTKNSETMFKKGVESLRNGNFNEAENCFEELKNIHPTNKDILNNLLISCFQNKKFEKSEKLIQNMFDLGFKDKKLIEFLLFILKQQDKIKEVIEIISNEKDKINKKYQLLEKFERPAIPMNKNEIDIIRKNTFKKINQAITDDNLKLTIDEQYLDPPMFYYSYDNEDNLELSKKLNELFRISYSELQNNFELKSNNNKKIKIGFVSEFFNNHTIEKLFKGLIFNLDISLFDISVFYLDNGKGFSKEFFKEEEKNKLKNFQLPKLFKEKIDFDFFNYAEEYPLATGFTWNHVDLNHLETRENLWQFYKDYLNKYNLSAENIKDQQLRSAISDNNEMLMHSLKWSCGNFNIYNVKKFLEHGWEQWMDEINEYGGLYKHRWGDLEALGLFAYTHFDNPLCDLDLRNKQLYEPKLPECHYAPSVRDETKRI